MEDGRLNRVKVGFIIQARMHSTRLPNKVLMPIPFKTGKPILQWISDELQRSKFINKIVVATSKNSENDLLEKFCRERKVHCFRGEEENVLSRYIHLARTEQFDVMVRLTGDNPIVDIKILDKVIEYHLQNSNDYTYSVGLPLGMNFEVVKPVALADLKGRELSKAENEHVTLFIRNKGGYKKGVYIHEEKQVPLEKLRTTIDYSSDFLLLSTILSQVDEGDSPNVNLIKALWKECPWIFDANQKNVQKRQFKNQKEEFRFAVELLDKHDFHRVSKILKSIE